MSKVTNIGSRIHSVERGNVVAGANEILDDAKGKKQNVINNEVDAELLRLDQSKQNNLTFDNTPTENSNNPVKSSGVYAADKALSDAIEAILILIPSAATALNQLADKNFVNSSIATDTATFRGTSDTGLSEAQFLEWANSLTHDMNDYVFWQTIDEAGNTLFKRYKWNGTQWLYEYTLNNSSFTADQWAAIMSGITSALVEKLNGLPTNAALQQALNSKQDALTFDNVPTENSTNPVKSGGVYSAVKTEEDARLNLAQTVSGIGGEVSQIEDVIPTGATSINKLVENASMEAYVASIIQNITSSFTLATTDGHINLTLTQTNGQVATLTLTSSDIASAQDVANLQQLYNNLQQSKPVPVTALPETGQQQGVIYRLAGTTSYSDYMWNGSTWVLMATYNNAIDLRPKKASQNLVTSGGVFDNMGALDVSELNATENPHTLAQYNDLSAALDAITTDYRKGGMSIKFVQSSDNKYVQYRLMAQTFSTTPSDWQGVNDEPTAGSDNLVKSGGVYKQISDKSAELNYLLNTASFLFSNKEQTYNLVKFKAGYKYNLKFVSGGATHMDMYYKVDDETAGVKIKTFVCSGGASDAYEWTAPVDADYLYYTISGNPTVVSVEPSTGLENEINAIKTSVNSNKTNIDKLQEDTVYLARNKVTKNSVRNLYDIEKIENGYFVNSSGVKSYLESYKNSRGLLKIYWNGNSSISLNCAKATGGSNICQYDASDNFIVGSNTTGEGELTIQKSEGAAYIYLEVLYNINGNYQINFGDELLNYTPFNPIGGYLTEIDKGKVNIDSINQYQEDKAEWGYWLNSSGTKVYTDGWKTTRGLIKVYWGNHNKITVNCAYAQGGTFTCQFDANGEFISGSNVAGNGLQTYTKANGAYYIYLAIGYAVQNKQIEFGTVLEGTYTPYNPISGYLKNYNFEKGTREVYAYADGSSDDTDNEFYGWKDGLCAWQRAIDSCDGITPTKIYCKGEIKVTQENQFHLCDDGLYYVVFCGPEKANVELIGEGEDKTKLVVEMADNYANYQSRLPMEIVGDNNVVRAMSIIAKNVRYCIHIDYSSHQEANGHNISLYDVTMHHKPNAGGGFTSPLGFGINPGMKVLCERCTFIVDDATPLLGVHDNIVNFDEDFTYTLRNCKLIPTAVSSAQYAYSIMRYYPMGSGGAKGTIVFEDVDFGMAQPRLLMENGNTRTDELTKCDANIFFKVSGHLDSPVGIGVGPESTSAVLRIVSKSTGTSSKVRFDRTSSAFDTIVRGLLPTDYTDIYGKVHVDGYQYRDGVTGLSGYAMGELAIDKGRICSLQNRLGDCSVSNKSLVISVDDVDYTITFDEDYTDYSDADMLAVFTDVIGGVADVYLYNWGAEYFPEIEPAFTQKRNNSGDVIFKGMGVHITSNGVSKATSDELVDAIAIDDILPNYYGRLARKAQVSLYRDDYHYAYLDTPPTTDNQKWNNPYSVGNYWGIGDTPGVFTHKNSEASMRVDYYGYITIDK